MRFVCSLWRGSGFEQPVAAYDESDVRYVAAALARYGHELTCIHDGTFDLPDIDCVLMPPYVAELPEYQPKLWVWSPELRRTITGVFAHIDLDCAVLDDPAKAFRDRDALQFWDWARDEPYNTSLMKIVPGAGFAVWHNRKLIDQARREWEMTGHRWTGDQSLVGWTLGPNQITFGYEDGIRQFRRRTMSDKPPPGVKVLFFCGDKHPRMESARWIAAQRESYLNRQ